MAPASRECPGGASALGALAAASGPAVRPDAVGIEHHQRQVKKCGCLWKRRRRRVRRSCCSRRSRNISLSSRALGGQFVMRPKQRVDSRQTKKTDPEVVHRMYEFGHARHLVQTCRKNVQLANHVTMDACTHGGMTGLGNAEATEQEIMSASGHRTPPASTSSGPRSSA